MLNVEEDEKIMFPDWG